MPERRPAGRECRPSFFAAASAAVMMGRMRRMASFLGRRLGGGCQLCPEDAGPRESASWVSMSSASCTSLIPICSEGGWSFTVRGARVFRGTIVQIQAAPPSTSFRGGGMRGTACACLAAAVLAACLLVSCCGVLRVSLGCVGRCLRCRWLRFPGSDGCPDRCLRRMDFRAEEESLDGDWIVVRSIDSGPWCLFMRVPSGAGRLAGLWIHA